MNQEFHIKGLSGLALFITVILAVLLAIAMLPALALMVTWNALVFEGFHGPAIHFGQGILLWIILAVALKVLLKPTMEIEFHTSSSEDAAFDELNFFNETRQLLDEEKALPQRQDTLKAPSASASNDLSSD
ncbi:MAG: hypothetical protein VKJ04_07135 [Vampirovibrionales bacterium]|nr:hypothetical protein [Vampirovibrionales bacterium]